MGKQQTKTVNQTFSIPLEVSQELHSFVKRREMSRFVTEAIRKELEVKKNALRNAYLDANQDEGQIGASKDWEGTVGDGSETW